MSDNWHIGQKVYVYGANSREPSSIATIEKIYKTGHLIVNGRRYRPSSYGTAYQTGDGYSRGYIKAVTPEREAQYKEVMKMRRIRMIGDWMTRHAKAEHISDDMLQALIEIRGSANNASDR